MTLADWATAHPSLVVLAWPLVSAIITAAFQRPSTAQILAAAGGRHLVLSLWSKALYLCAALGIDSRSVVALLRAALTPKPPKPPSLPPPPHTVEIPMTVDLDPAPSNTNAGHPPFAARLAIVACITAAMVVAGAAMGCSALSTDVTTYAPTPAQELGVVNYGGEEQECTHLDASAAVKRACVAKVQCEHGRDAAGPCPDAGLAEYPFTTAESWLAENGSSVGAPVADPRSVEGAP